MSNAKKWSELLNGREYRSELTSAEERQAAADDVLIIFGASDDLMEIRGLITDEAGCYEGGDVFIGESGVLEHDEDQCECEFCAFDEAKQRSLRVVAKWDTEGFSWVYDVGVPAETFVIVEDGETYCRGIVIDGASWRQVMAKEPR